MLSSFKNKPNAQEIIENNSTAVEKILLNGK
jgi:hypothetical protein